MTNTQRRRLTAKQTSELAYALEERSDSLPWGEELLPRCSQIIERANKSHRISLSDDELASAEAELEDTSQYLNWL